MNTITTTEGFIALVLGFGFIIFVHELGHFLVAKAVGIKVTQFALGMGHALLAWRKGIGMRVGTTEPELDRRVREYLTEKVGVTFDETNPNPSERQTREAIDAMELGETEYRLNWLPLGGYVKMMGQDDMDPTAISTDPRSFSAKPAWARAGVISAGVIMNLIFAMVFFVVAFTYGVEFPRNIVGPVQPGSPAASVYARGHDDDPDYKGIHLGDHVMSIDDQPVEDFMQITLATALAEKGAELTFEVVRPGELRPLYYEITPKVSSFTKLLSVGIDVPRTTQLQALNKSAAAYKADVRPDMIITAVEGKPIATFAEYHEAIITANGLPVDVTFTHPDTDKTITVALRAMPSLCQSKDAPAHLLGMVPATYASEVIEAQEGEKPLPAQKAGMKSGDIFVQFGNASWPTPDQVIEQVKVAAGRKDSTLHVTVLRNGQIIELPPMKPSSDKTVGIALTFAMDTPIIGHTIAGSPAAALNLNPGTTITSLNGASVQNWMDMQLKLQMDSATADKQAEILLGYRLNIADQPESQSTIKINETQISKLVKTTWLQPIPYYYFTVDRKLIKANDTSHAISLGFEKTQQMTVQTYLTLARLFQGTVKVKHLKGPIGIVDIGTKVAKQGWTYLLFFLGLISVNLVVINFLPMPIVDGGLMVFLIVEKIKGSPVSPKVLSIANLVGLVMIAGLFLTVTYNDIVNLKLF